MKKIGCLLLILAVGTLAQAGVRGDLRKGGQYYEDQKYGSALNSYQKILKKHPDNPQALFNAGNAYYRLKEYTQAQESYQKAAKNLAQKTPDALFNLGNAYYKAGDQERAKEAFRAAIVQNPDDKEAIHNLQLILQQQQQENQQNQDQPQQNQDDSQGQQNDEDQSQNPDENNQNENQKGQLSQQDADRIMAMAKEQEYKSHSGNRAQPEYLVEKDW